jgi:NADH:ubiquinone oxidoreductase subunit E
MNERSGQTSCPEKASDAELMKRLDATLAEYKGRPGALIPVLQIAQGIYGYLPDGVIKHIALSLGKSYSEVAGVVGFYSFFSTVPRGKHLVRVCLGTACYVRGGKQVLAACQQELGIDVGGTTPDGQFTLEVARCFGACGLAPTMMIDEDVHQRVKPQKLRSLFDVYRDGANGKHAKPATQRGAARSGAKKTAAGKAVVKKAAAPKKAAKAGAAPKRAAGKKIAAKRSTAQSAAKKGAAQSAAKKGAAQSAAKKGAAQSAAKKGAAQSAAKKGVAVK